ncbi:MAG: ion transporter [Pedobacter sp.]|nr:MAG: ion transporter [Pedobacter sp.]
MKIDRDNIPPVKSRLDFFRQKLYIIIYGVNTPAGKAFDVGLLIVILLSVFTIMLETVEGVNVRFHNELVVLEWLFTIAFTLEYIIRIFISNRPFKYIFSFYGIIDLLSILPMFLSLFISGSNILSSFRILRLLRLFRVFRLMEFMEESSKLKVALLASRAKIMVFLYAVTIIAILIGTLMYYVEGPENGFTSPTGIVGVEIAKEVGKSISQNKTGHSSLNGIVCAHCNREGHRNDAEYCFRCGHELNI